MSIKWIKDADTGELFPVQDDFECDIPEHLKTAECNHIDYEKTTRTTIDELQSRLTAAQNEIAVIQQERELPLQSDSEICNEIVTTKHFDFNLSKIIIAIFVAAIAVVTVVFACKFVSDNDFVIDTNISVSSGSSDYEFSPIYSPGSIPIYTGEDGASLYINSNSSKSDEKQEAENEQECTEQSKDNLFIRLFLRLIPVIILILGVRISVGFLIKTVRGC